MRMRLSTRAFLWSFVPFALLLAGSFWVIQRQVQSAVREGLHSSLRQAHESMAHMREQSELQNSRFLRIVGESAALKAGVQLVLADPKSGDARFDQQRALECWINPSPAAPATAATSTPPAARPGTTNR